MNNAIIYARVSSREQELEGFSIPAQLKIMREYAAKNHLLVVQEFTDVETAKKAGRTQFSKMITYIREQGSIKNILVEKTDRLLRNISDYALIDKLIEQDDIKVHLIKENVVLSKDSRSNEKFIFGIKALMAKNYIDNLSEEVRKGQSEKAAQGIYPSIAPYGYSNAREGDKKIIAVDPEAAPYVKKMFELYATGSYSIKKLRQKMLADGFIYRNGKLFYNSTLETILKNEFYTGTFRWRGKRYENASHTPIISKELFARVQDMLINPHKAKSRKGLFTYALLIKCGVCGCRLTAEIKKGKYIYYHCTGKKGDCKQTYLRQEVIEEQFEQLLSSIQVDEGLQMVISDGLRASMQDKVEYHTTLVAQLEKQIKLLQNRIDQAYLDKLDGKISEDAWQTHTRKWVSEKEEHLIKLLALQKADVRYLENANLVFELANKAAALFKNQNSEQKRRVINLITSNCSYKDQTLDIELKPAFSMILSAGKSEKWWS